MKTSVVRLRAAALAGVIAFSWLGCFRSPDIADIKCVDDATCPRGYYCAVPGQPGGCHKRIGDGSVADVPQAGDGLGPVDVGAGETLRPLDGSALDGSSERGPGPIDQAQDIPNVGLDGGEVGGALDVALTGLDAGAGGAAGQGGAGGATSAGGSGGTVAVDAAGGAGGANGGAGGTNATGGSSAGTGGVVVTGGTTEATGGAVATGGIIATGGSGTGGSGGTGTGGNDAGPDLPPSNPAGYYTTKDWGISSYEWRGCAWTGTDSVTGSTTTIAPVDFIGGTPQSGPYRVSGRVHANYDSMAMLGFNLNEAPTGLATQCKVDPARLVSAGPPAATIPASANGIAIAWSAATLPANLRVVIQGVDGSTNPAHRWCANLLEPTGPSFIPFTAFNTRCWDPSTGTAYNREAIDAILFQVPGTVAQSTAFDFTIAGFAAGTSVADAPGDTCGKATGSIGSATPSQDASYQRAKLVGTDCKQYVLQNNNFGNPTATSQVLSFTGNAFTVVSSTGSGSGYPASFPSLYVGANGNIAGGAFSTWTNSNLPKQISALSKAQASFAWSGRTGGDFDAIYDLWFAKSAPTAGAYAAPVSGELTVWLYKPAGRQPIGMLRRTATVAGYSWDVWVGPMGSSGTGTDDALRPVVSYVIKGSSLPALAVDLKAFIVDAVTNGGADMGAGGTSQAFASSWYLTDVFGGFEIWTGADAVGLKATNFSCAIQ